MGLQISISDSIVRALRLPEKRIEQELRRELAIALYTQDILSFGKARVKSGNLERTRRWNRFTFSLPCF
jgi:Uncharacterised protein family (UPF0175)